MIPYLTIALGLCTLLTTAYMNFVRSARKRHDAAVAETAQPAPEPKAPCDISRAYPRPKGRSTKLNRVCPVCGTGRETGELDGKVLGWPAHASCAEWLGDWHPRRPAPPPYNPDRDLIGYMEGGQKGGRSISIGGGGGIASTGDGTVNVTVTDGMSAWPLNLPLAGSGDPETATWALSMGLVSRDEVRERIVGIFGVPPPDIGEGAFQRYRCQCGMEFQGGGPDLERSLKVHRASGQCEQRRKFAAADPGPIA